MTESEAKTRWCPMVRTGQVFDFGKFAAVNDRHAANCIGSACMMWRWDQGDARMLPVLDRPDCLEVHYDRPGNGYCGLAGKG